MKPELWIAGGPKTFDYGYGYWTGPQKDLLCVIDNISDNNEAEYYLSPMSRIKCFAYLGYLITRFCKVVLIPVSSEEARKEGKRIKKVKIQKWQIKLRKMRKAKGLVD